MVRVEPGTGPSVSICYVVGDEVVLESTVDRQYALEVVSAVPCELERVRARYGTGSVVPVEELARQFSEVFLPPDVLGYVRDGQVERLVAVAEESALYLPWELAHDGSGFLAINVSVIHGTGEESAGSALPRGRSALIVEGIPELFGVQPTHFLPDSDRSISRHGARITRAHARDQDQLRNAVSGASHDLIWLNFHSMGDERGEPVILLGDGAFSLLTLADSMVNSIPEVVVLSACETGMSGVKHSYGESSAFRMSSVLPGCYVREL